MLRAEKIAAKGRAETEKLSPMRLRLSIRKSMPPLKKEAPLKSIWGREKTFESFSKIMIKAINPIPMGKLI